MRRPTAPALKLSRPEATLLQDVIIETCESSSFADDLPALTRVYNAISAAPGKRVRHITISIDDARLLRESVEHVGEIMRRTGDTTDLTPLHGKLGTFLYQAGADR